MKTDVVKYYNKTSNNGAWSGPLCGMALLMGNKGGRDYRAMTNCDLNYVIITCSLGL